MAKLQAYRAKRNFTKTPEPAGITLADAGNRFVVHKHHATADHYDLRLQVGGVLKSWAVPKGPSLNPADKRLAVETEDHPLEYIDFEGVIPKGEYGGGPMIVWDTGTWAPMDDVEKSLKTGAFKFRLAGEKLNGGWMLARLKGKPEDKGKKNWLLFKERDLAARREGRHPRRAPREREVGPPHRGTGRGTESRPPSLRTLETRRGDRCEEGGSAAHRRAAAGYPGRQLRRTAG